ncbi:MAG: hypothetical protein HETSPECPRED_002971 [Heterodermia speciosa]|uniref:Uncharacterized protein n=1 Tax=Heterodermia speciosa TaxID=116794 RepID=A0A8H3EZW7_9LECA|nr:MAG: hypothetical protein HETSPECPRED_002971 [Heterodermia speciosa]
MASRSLQINRGVDGHVSTFFASGTSPVPQATTIAGEDKSAGTMADGYGTGSDESEPDIGTEAGCAGRDTSRSSPTPATASEKTDSRNSTTEGSQAEDPDIPAASTERTQGERRYQYHTQDQWRYQYEYRQEQSQEQGRYEGLKQHYPRPITFSTQVRFRDRAHRLAFCRSLVWEFISWITVGYFVWAWCRNYERYFSGELNPKPDANLDRNENENGNGDENGNEKGDRDKENEKQARLRSKRGLGSGRAKSKKGGTRRRGGFRTLKAVLRHCCFVLVAAWRGVWARIREVCRGYGNGYTPQSTPVRGLFSVPMSMSVGTETERVWELVGLEIEGEGVGVEDGSQFGGTDMLRRRRGGLMPVIYEEEEEEEDVAEVGIAAPGPGRGEVGNRYAGSMMEAIDDALLSYRG